MFLRREAIPWRDEGLKAAKKRWSISKKQEISIFCFFSAVLSGGQSRLLLEEPAKIQGVVIAHDGQIHRDP